MNEKIIKELKKRCTEWKGDGEAFSSVNRWASSRAKPLPGMKRVIINSIIKNLDNFNPG